MQAARPARRAAHQPDGLELAAVEQALARRGRRVTRQRRMIVARFARMRRYVTPQQLHKSLAGARPAIALATVYRTLGVLEQVGAATRAPGEHGEQAYLFCPIAHHHHAVCTKCGNVDDVPCGSVERFARTLAGRLSFRLTQHRLEFYGLCRRCA